MRRVSGFTLVEMMVVAAILAILASIALPSFRPMIANNRIVANTNDLIADLALARSEAAKRGGTTVVTVCASSDGSSCSGSTDWSGGRLVFLDGGTQGAVDGTDSTNVLRNSRAVSNLVLTSTVASFSYLSDGSVSSNLPGTVTVCSSGVIGRIVSISNIGRAKVDATAAACS
ncbi:GspH/FimT family pseudopilin [Ferribacterium limneticum]|uniref:GspH/FimT family pseudopilin n=1 Tax=Ferribacterium limneticum TaxID=76259 RepID=UPI00299EF99D|nr:GspH/FimT family pseudopilin [Ferribacterium limneticum]UCV20470.1 GspH/FimT family pseudopilin [Ferribacterium limneticum]